MTVVTYERGSIVLPGHGVTLYLWCQTGGESVAYQQMYREVLDGLNRERNSNGSHRNPSPLLGAALHEATFGPVVEGFSMAQAQVSPHRSIFVLLLRTSPSSDQEWDGIQRVINQLPKDKLILPIAMEGFSAATASVQRLRDIRGETQSVVPRTSLSIRLVAGDVLRCIHLWLVGAPIG